MFSKFGFWLKYVMPSAEPGFHLQLESLFEQGGYHGGGGETGVHGNAHNLDVIAA